MAWDITIYDMDGREHSYGNDPPAYLGDEPETILREAMDDFDLSWSEISGVAITLNEDRPHFPQ